MITQFAQYRRNIARHKKLEEQFNKADTNGNRKITSKQMRKIFEDNEIVGKFCFVINIVLSDNQTWVILFKT